jgi:hypothetical protein
MSPHLAARIASYVAHVLCVVGVGTLLVQYPGPVIPALVVGALISAASLSAIEHRIVPLYVAFGLMLGPAFWMVVSAVNARFFLEALPPVLLIAAVAATLQNPGWIPAAFSTVAVGSMLWVNRYEFVHRFDNDFFEADHVVRAVVVISTLISLSLLELLCGVAIHELPPPQRKKKKKKIKRAAESDL